MMQSVLAKIVENVETTLLGIQIAAGYQHTAASVQRIQQTLTSIADVPALLIVMRDVRAADEEPWSVQDWILTLEVEVVFVADPETVEFERDQSGNPTESTDSEYFSWLDDINKALLVDRTRGGNAIDTRIVGMEPVPVNSENRLAGIIVDTEIRYRHRYGSAQVAI